MGDPAGLVRQLLLFDSVTETEDFRVDAVYQPDTEPGGDFCQVIQCNDHSLLVLLGEVALKGWNGAIVAALIVGAIRNRKSDEPNELLSELSRVLQGGLPGGSVSCCCARFEYHGMVTLSSAGHSHVLTTEQVVDLPTGPELGSTPEPSYQQLVIHVSYSSSLTFLAGGLAKAELTGQPASAIADSTKGSVIQVHRKKPDSAWYAQ